MRPRAGLDLQIIVQSATELADQSGLEALNMAALAARLGVRAPTLYHYVAGQAGLRRALALRGIADISARIGRAIMGKAGDGAVLALAHTLHAFATEHPGLYAAAQHAPINEDAEWQAAGREVVAIMLRALDAYQLTDEEGRQAVRMLRSMAHGCIALEHLGAFGLPHVADETFQRLLIALLGYLHREHTT